MVSYNYGYMIIIITIIMAINVTFYSNLWTEIKMDLSNYSLLKINMNMRVNTNKYIFILVYHLSND